MGSVSDRIGRTRPLVAGMVALAAGTLLFGVSRSLPWLFAARLLQGAADGMTWAVGFALIADLYGPVERGRVMGVVMSSAGAGVMIGPPFGGWLYQLGGTVVPFLAIGVAAAILAGAFALLPEPPRAADHRPLGLGALLRVPGMISGASVGIAASMTIGMVEAVTPFFWARELELGPGEIGTLFGLAALVSAVLHPLYGHLGGQWGERTLMLAGLAATAGLLPLLGRSRDLVGAGAVLVALWAAIGMTTTPSLAYVGAQATRAGIASFGLVYGVYNVAWGIGLMGGPAAGGFLYERVGFERLGLLWLPILAAVAIGVFRRPRALPAPPTAGR
jgi:MFS family permease